MKLYFHFDDVSLPSYTKIIHVEAEQLVREVVSSFFEAYASKHGRKIDLSQIEAHIDNLKRKKIQLGSQCKDCLVEKGDVFVSLHASSAEPGVSSSRVGVMHEADPFASIKEAMTKADKLVSARNLSGARVLYERILQVDPNNLEAICKLARIWLNAGKGERALGFAHKSLALSKGKDASLPHQLIGEACLLLDQYEVAVEHLERSKTKEASISLAKALHQWSVSLASTNDILSHQIHQQCASHVMQIVEGDSESWEGLFWYSRIALDQGLVEDSIRVSLRLIVRKKDSVEAKELLADGVSSPGGLSILIKELGSGAESASALAFLATTMKESSCLEASIFLFKKAVDIDANPNYLLNYIHAMELGDETSAPFEIVAVVADFLESRSKVVIPGLIMKSVSTLLKKLGPLESSLGWYKSEHGISHLSVSATSYLNPLMDNQLKIDYSTNQLDLLATLFTVTKVLYIAGAIELARQLVDLVEPAKRASKVELHYTLIRNEAAYFSCIAQILRYHPPHHEEASKELYLIGDSHCLSGAWRSVERNGEKHLLRPLLVTGVKIWHLRPSSCFYPKLQFFNAIARVPRGSSVVIVIGEIDCREGFLLAVQRSKYENLDEAIEATVDIYIKLLTSLIETLDLQIYVHPIPPVLDPTRPIVIKFMDILERRIVDASVAKLHLLGFFSDLMEVTPDGSHGLRSDLSLDGTHLSPHYVPIMNKRLQWS